MTERFLWGVLCVLFAFFAVLLMTSVVMFVVMLFSLPGGCS